MPSKINLGAGLLAGRSDVAVQADAFVARCRRRSTWERVCWGLLEDQPGSGSAWERSPLAIGLSLPTTASVGFEEGEHSLVDLRSETVRQDKPSLRGLLPTTASCSQVVPRQRQVSRPLGHQSLQNLTGLRDILFGLRLKGCGSERRHQELVECEAGRRWYVDESGSAVNEQCLLGRLQKVLEVIQRLSGCIEAPDEDRLVRTPPFWAKQVDSKRLPSNLEGCRRLLWVKRRHRQETHFETLEDGRNIRLEVRDRHVDVGASCRGQVNVLRAECSRRPTGRPAHCPTPRTRGCRPKPLLRRIGRTPRGLAPHAQKDHPS